MKNSGTGPGKPLERLKAVLDSLDAVVYVADMKTYEILFANKYVRDVFGEITGKLCWRTLQKDQTGPCSFCSNDKLIDAAGRPTGLYTWEIRNTKNGRWYDIRDRAIPWTDGRLVRLEIATDITERKESEERIKTYAGDLEEANRLKDLFTDILHHDLLSPAVIVKNYSDLLSKANSQEERVDYAERIQHNAERMIEIIESASTLAKLEKQDFLEHKAIDLREFFLNAAAEIEPLLAAREIALEERTNGTCMAEGNPIIAQVFSNLLENAVKYSPERGQIEVFIKGEGDTCVVRIADRGPGIDDTDKERVFERFKRIEKGGVKGTGLGLAIAKKIVHLHGGEIWVEDNPAGGSIFCFRIPCSKKGPVQGETVRPDSRRQGQADR